MQWHFPWWPNAPFGLGHTPLEALAGGPDMGCVLGVGIEEKANEEDNGPAWPCCGSGGHRCATHGKQQRKHCGWPPA
eukprot:11193892-Lingulodinium_polyedra.AAC.1